MREETYTAFITGASRGIGREIAKKLARMGMNVVIAAKTEEPHPKLDGTIHSVKEEIEHAGGNALAVKCDVRDEEAVKKAVTQTLETFGSINFLINNASAIVPARTLDLDMKRFDLMQECNGRAAFMVSKTFIPHLLKQTKNCILNLSPPLNLDPKWFKDYLGYTMSKYAMSFTTIGLAKEFEGKLRVCSLWPKTLIQTAAIQTFFPKMMEKARSPRIVADAAAEILLQREESGAFYIDEDVLKESGVDDFSDYGCENAMPDLFL